MQKGGAWVDMHGALGVDACSQGAARADLQTRQRTASVTQPLGCIHVQACGCSLMLRAICLIASEVMLRTPSPLTPTDPHTVSHSEACCL